MKRRHITAAQLRKAGACSVDDFIATYGRKIRVTPLLCEKLAQTENFDWLIENLLKGPNRRRAMRRMREAERFRSQAWDMERSRHERLLHGITDPSLRSAVSAGSRMVWVNLTRTCKLAIARAFCTEYLR